MNIRSSKLLYDKGLKIEKSEWENYKINDTIFDFCYRNDFFYAIGAHKIYKSRDLVNWTSYNLTNNTSIMKKIVNLGDSLFILCDYDSGGSYTNLDIDSYIPTVYFSDIGTYTYDALRFSTTGNWKNCVFKNAGGDRYIVGYKTVSGVEKGVISNYQYIGSGGSGSYGWTNPVTLECGCLNCIIRVNDSHIAVGNNGSIAIKNNYGANWIVKNVGGDSLDWNSIAYGNGRYVIVSKDGHTSMSKDLENWTTPIQKNEMTNPIIIFAADKFFMISRNGKVNTSYYGTDWNNFKELDPSVRPNTMISIKYFNGKILIGTYGSYLFYKTWEQI